MSEERRRILNMLAEGKITADEAEELLEAISGSEENVEKSYSFKADPDRAVKNPKFLRIMVEPTEANGKGERVNIRIPMLLLRAGVKLASVIPTFAQDKIDEKLQEKGIQVDLKNLDKDALNDVVSALSAMTIDAEDGKEKVKIFCE